MNAQRPIFDPDRMAAQEDPILVPRTLTVSQLNALVKRVLVETLPGTVHLIGEISNFSQPSSGHLYLTLKDDRSEVRAVMWRSAAAKLKFKPGDGLEVIATGHVDIYEPRGQYQFYIRKLEPCGVGALELAFRQRRERLAHEGLFDPAHKKPIPAYPRQIAVVTSPTGAAIRDVLQTLRRRYGCAAVLLHPVRVQGEDAARQIADAIGRLNAQADALGGIDVIIVTRGGGSLEDLWAFNEETVARAIFDSKIPIISGVGHEVDLTIADLVADLRAPTPTAAAELAVPVLEELLESLANAESRLRRSARHRLDLTRSRLEAVQRAEWFRDPLSAVHYADQRIDEMSSRLQLAWSQQLVRLRQRLHQMEVVLAALQPGTFLRQQCNRLSDATHRLRWALERRSRTAERQIEEVAQTLLTISPAHRLQRETERVRQYHRHLNQATAHRVRLVQQRLDALDDRIQATSYPRTLARGFTITRTVNGRRIITHPEQVTSGERIATQTAGGEFESNVTGKSET